MKILFFSTHINTQEVAEKWRVFVNELTRRGVTNVIIFTSRRVDSDRINYMREDNLIEVGSLEEEEEQQAGLSHFSENHAEDYRGIRIYLDRLGEPDPGRWIERHKCLFEIALKRFGINRVCLAVGDAYNSPLYAILENVCRLHDIKTDLIQAPAFRVGVFDDLNRSSAAIQQIYDEKLAIGLTREERGRMLDYCNAYRQFTTSSEVLDYMYQVRYPGSNIIYRIFSRVRRKRYVIFDDLIPEEKEYFLFLPNKLNNYRQLLLAPHFSDNPVLVEKISSSLPKNTLLVVKDHPHSSRGSLDYKLIKTVRALPNCIYVDPRKYTSDQLISGARGVITVASTAIIDVLVQMKPVVTFGRKPYLVDVDPPPIFKVTSVEELPGLFRQIKQTKEQIEHIEAFLYAFLSHTHSRLDGSKNHWGEQLRLTMDIDTVFRNYAKVYAEHLENMC